MSSRGRITSNGTTIPDGRVFDATCDWIFSAFNDAFLERREDDGPCELRRKLLTQASGSTIYIRAGTAPIGLFPGGPNGSCWLSPGRT